MCSSDLVHAVDVFAVDTQYSVAFGFQVFDDVQPASSIIPILRLAAGLGGYTDIGLLYFPCFILGQQPDADVLRLAAFVQAQDHGRVFMQASYPKV